MMHTGTNSGEVYQILTVLIDKDHEELAPESYSITAIVAGYSAFRYRLFTNEYALAELSKGSLYFMNSLMFGTRIYSANHEPLIVTPLNAVELYKKAEVQHIEIMNKVQKFREGAAFYAAGQNYTEATFALRQAVEVLFRWAEFCLRGHEEKIRRYYDHQTAMRGFSQRLYELFTIHHPDQRPLMKLFDEVYLQPENTRPVISIEDYEVITVKATLLEKEVEEIFNELLHKVKRCIHNPSGRDMRQYMVLDKIRTPKPTTATIDDSALAAVVKLIVSFIIPEFIYCFGQRNRHSSHGSAISSQFDLESAQLHFDLLIVTDDMRSNLIADCTELVRTKTNGQCNVTIILHKRKHISYTMSKQQHFFWKVLSHGKKVYQLSGAAALEISGCPARDVDMSRKYCKRRKTIADFFLEAATADISDEGQGQLAMLHLVAEHICLALIEAFLGYRPTHYSLGYLFDLCGHFTALPSEICPRNTVEDRRLFKLLSSGIANLRLRNLMNIILLQLKSCRIG
ncbi:MAG TPA: hypothetical protein VGB44_00425 [Flavobacterium sp.]|jgi:hypothetical protein